MAKKIMIDELRPLGLPAREIDRIARNSTLVSLRQGERLARHGELPRQMFLLLSGSAQVTRRGEPVAELGALDLVGEMALVQRDLYRAADVHATEPSTALVFSAKEWWALEESAPTFASHVRAVAASRSELAAAFD